ncbi:VWFA domain-containing protein [Entamoeba marina]
MFKTGASHAFLRKEAQNDTQLHEIKEEPNIDVNVVSIELCHLKEESEVQNNFPICCSNCNAALTSNIPIENNTWKCQFCNTNQKIEDEQKQSIIKAESVDYIKEKKEVTEKQKGVIVYCIDVSGSMMGSRLEACKAAICQQMTTLKESDPERRVCIIEFESEVSILGDCTKTSLQINNKMLDDFDSLVDIGKEKVDLDSISATSESIIKTVSAMHTKGCTALGPALLLGTVIAGKEVGGQIILCTDGCANEGLGRTECSFGDGGECKSFYEKVTQLAKDKGVMVNINTISGCYSNLKILGEVAAETYGEILIVDPSNISSAFGDALDKELIATEVRIKIFLHPSMYLDDNDQSNLKYLVIGNVLDDSAHTFGYHFKSEHERRQYGDVMNYPIQVQIQYKNMKGEYRVRIINQEITVTDNVEEIQMDNELLQNFYMQQTAQNIRKGNKVEAQKRLNHWKNVPKMSYTTQNQQAYDDYGKHFDEYLDQDTNFVSDSTCAFAYSACNFSNKKAGKYGDHDYDFS